MHAAVILALIIAMLLVGALFWAMLRTSRPEGGWKASMESIRSLSGSTDQVASQGGAEEPMSDGVSITTLLDEAEVADGYYTVPKRYEDRIENIAGRIVNGVDRVRSRPERRDV